MLRFGCWGGASYTPYKGAQNRGVVVDSEDANNRLTAIILVLVMSLRVGEGALSQGSFTVLSLMYVPRL